jgi:hypothetical protein
MSHHPAKPQYFARRGYAFTPGLYTEARRGLAQDPMRSTQQVARSSTSFGT